MDEKEDLVTGLRNKNGSGRRKKRWMNCEWRNNNNNNITLQFTVTFSFSCLMNKI